MARTGTGRGSSGAGGGDLGGSLDKTGQTGSQSTAFGGSTLGSSGSTPGSSGDATPGLQGGSSFGSDSGSQARDRRAAGEAGGIAQTLKDTTYRSIDTQKSKASETLGSLAGAVRGMTQPLRDGGQDQIAGYVDKAADGIERWASQMRQQDLEDAVRAVQQFARRQPAMFLGIAFGAGLVAARFLKSSGRDGGMQTRHYGNFNTGGGPTGMRAGDFGTGGAFGASGSFGTAATTGTRGAGGSTSGDIPRVSSDIRPAGEVL